MKKIVINTCYGGFGYSDKAREQYGLPECNWKIDRDDPMLVKAVEELGDKANYQFSELKVVEIPDGIDWSIEEYDGMEHVAEAHQTWS